MLSNTAWTYAKLRTTFPYGGSPDVCQHELKPKQKTIASVADYISSVIHLDPITARVASRQL